MSVVARELMLSDLLGLLPKLDPTHREEIKRTHPDLEKWALDRATQPGISWGLFDGHDIVAAGGIVSHGEKGTLWFAGAAGWQRYALHPVRIFKAVLETKVYGLLECQCYEENKPAQRFAEYLGFKRGEVRDGLVHYARAA